MNNIFQGTLENMVFCINEFLSTNIYRIISRKSCSVIDCAKNWTYNRKLILASNGQCVDECPKNTRFNYDYKCYYRCPNETLPDDFICKENFDYYIDEGSCTVKNYFLNVCKKRLYSPIDKKHFIESTVNDFLKGKLYDLALMSLENQKKFIIREETETYAIYALSNKNRENDLVYINMDECIETLKEAYKLPKDFIIFQIQYKSPDLKIPIVEYSIFALFGIKKLEINPCRNLKARYYIPLNISNYEDFKYNPENDFYYNKCLPYSYENSIDLSINERKAEFNRNNMSLCENICTFKGYINNYVQCECDIKLKFNSFFNNLDKTDLIHKIEIKKKSNINFWVLQCFFFIFSKEVITNNICSIIILAIIFLFIVGAIIFYAKEKKILFHRINISIKLIFFKEKKSLLNKKDNNKENDKKENNNKNDNNNNKEDKNNNIKKEHNKNNNNKKDNNKKELILQQHKFSKRNRFLNRINNFQSSSRVLKSNSKDSFIGNKRIDKQNEEHQENFFKMIENLQKGNNKLNRKEKFEEIERKTYNELNSLSYGDALEKDKRTFFQYYISLLMTKQLLLFAFNCKNDFNSKIMKICFFLYMFSIFLFVNTISIDISSLYELFISKGKIDIFYDYNHLILITTFCQLIKIIILLTAFTEEEVISIRNSNSNKNRKDITKALIKINIKCHLFFFFSILTLCFIWIYISCFFTIFKKTQFYVIINALIIFGISLVFPFVFGIFTSAFRIIALVNRDNSKIILFYLISKLLQILL